MYNVDLYPALLSSVCKELHIHIDNGIFIIHSRNGFKLGFW